MNALGYHLLFHSYGVEIGSWYGDQTPYIARMTAAETSAYEQNGVNATTKHFIARGGRSNYNDAKSPADLLDSWLVGWKAAVDAGTSWIMMNHGSALNDCYTIYDKETLSLLRDRLGYEGCIVTDWPMWVGAPSATGTAPDGTDLSTLTAGQLYTYILEADIDQFGCYWMVHGTDESPEHLTEAYPGHSFGLSAYPDSLIADIEAIAAYAEVVEDAADADVVVARLDDIDEAEEIIEEAKDAGAMLVMAIQAGNGSNEPDTYICENADAVLMFTYNTTPDHGSAIAGAFYNHYVLSSTFADMLFGAVEPTGSLVYEIARNRQDAGLAWGELAVDTGVTIPTRLYMAATMRQNPETMLPTNLGDVLYPADFGMRYGQDADISLNTLVMEQYLVEQEVETGWGTSIQKIKINKTVKPGEEFPVYMIAENKGADGVTVAEVVDNGEVIASRIVSVEGGSFAIVTIPVVLEDAGEHTISVGDNTLTVIVE